MLLTHTFYYLMINGLQNRPFCVAKQAVSCSKTDRFASRNRPFRNAKRPV